MTSDERLFILALAGLVLLLGLVFWLVFIVRELAELVRFLIYGQGDSARRKDGPMKRPAEIAGASAGTVGIGAALATHNYLALAVAFAGYLPALVTFLRANGGVRGVVGSLWGGKKRESGYGIIGVIIVILVAALAYWFCLALGLPVIVGIAAAILVLLAGAGSTRYLDAEVVAAVRAEARPLGRAVATLGALPDARTALSAQHREPDRAGERDHGSDGRPPAEKHDPESEAEKGDPGQGARYDIGHVPIPVTCR